MQVFINKIPRRNLRGICYWDFLEISAGGVDSAIQVTQGDGCQLLQAGEVDDLSVGSFVIHFHVLILLSLSIKHRQ